MPEKISLSQQSAPEQVPSDAIAIPSEGRFYPDGHPLHQAQFIEIRPMTAREEDILTSRALFKSGKVIDALLRSCIVDKNIDPSQMLVGDRNAAIIGIRVSGYGSSYSVAVECPSCNTKNEISVDLGELPLRKVPEDALPTAPFVNDFTYKLPGSGKVVHFRIPTGADQQELSTLIDRMRKTVGVENLVTSRLQQQIISIDGELDKAKLSNIIRSLPAKDSRDLRNYMDYCTPDVVLAQKFNCGFCEYSAEEVEVPLGTDFFWPKS